MSFGTIKAIDSETMIESSTASLRYIFVLTYGRSGSTLFMKLLNHFPGAEIRGENNNALFHLYKSIQRITDAHKDHGFRDKGTENPWFGASQMAPDKFTRACLDSFVTDVLAPSKNTTVTGFKEIRHMPDHMSDEEFTGYAAFILEHFPGAKIVFLTRDAEKVSQSGWFKKRPPTEVIPMVRASDERFRAFCENRDDCVVLDHDDVVKNGEALMDVISFLGFRPDTDVAEDVLSVQLNHVKELPQNASSILQALKRYVRKVLR